MVTRIHIDGLFDMTLTMYGLFVVIVLLVVCLIVAVIIRERSIRKYLREMAERRQKLGKVK